MIIDAIFILCLVPLSIILVFLQGITAAFTNIIPDQLYNSVTTFIQYLAYLNPIFPIDTLLYCISTLAIFFTCLYIIKILLWIWSLVPYLGNHVNLPKLRIGEEEYKISSKSKS